MTDNKTRTITYYKLKHADDETKKFYIGSTENLENRKKEHKYTYNKEKEQLKLYGYIRSNGGWDAWTFEILEQEECKDDTHRHIGRYKKEALLIKQHKAELNTTSPQAYDPEDCRKQICGRCGITLDITKTTEAQLKKHHNTVKCKKSPPPVIVKGSNNTINISYMRGKKPIIIEGDNNTINIHY